MLGPYLLAALLGYLLGSTPTGYLVGRAKGVDIRQHGSGNIGATNVWRVLGRGPGLVVFFCDALKGFLTVWAGYHLGHRFFSPAVMETVFTNPDPARPQALAGAANHLASEIELAAIVAAIFCILGHNFPVWLGFRGGKGIATTTGVLLGLMPLAVAVGAVVWAAAFFALRYVSVASLLAAAALPVTVGFLWRAGRADAALFAFSLLAAALAFWRHRSNLQRLMNGTEPRFEKKPHAEAQSRRD